MGYFTDAISSAKPSLFTDSDSSDVYTRGDDDGSPTANDADSADDIDPRKLIETPDLSEIRFYYRNTFASKIVDKPIKDAFKNGFEVRDDHAKSVRDSFDDYDFIEKHISAEIKSRRDGFCFIYYNLKDTNPRQAPPQDVREIVDCKVITIDKLTDDVTHTQLEAVLPDDYDIEDYEVLEEGVVVSTDIDDERWGEPIGYLLDAVEVDPDSGRERPILLHPDRCEEYVWNEHVDGDVDELTFGSVVGDSVLQSSFHLFKWLFKGDWALMQAVFRDASQLYTVTLPKDADEEERKEADKELDNINAKSALTFPHGYEADSHDTGSQLDPEAHFDIIFEQICAANEMTKSVLFGTQSGTVSGSETDIKNYYNKVERYRRNRAERKFRNHVRKVNEWDKSIVPNLSLDFDVHWHPMFRVSEEDRMEMLRTFINTGKMAVDGYLLTPDEIRSIADSFEWADIQIDLDDLAEDDFDQLDRINQHQMGTQYGEQQETEVQGNPREQNGGGMPEGHQTAANDPSRGS